LWQIPPFNCLLFSTASGEDDTVDLAQAMREINTAKNYAATCKDKSQSSRAHTLAANHF
jgi:hypothetical protein